MKKEEGDLVPPQENLSGVVCMLDMFAVLPSALGCYKAQWEAFIELFID